MKKKKKKKQKRVRERVPSSLEALTTSTENTFAHQHTVTVNSRRRVLEFEGSEIDRAVVALTASLANRRRQRREIDAQLRGLASVVAKR